MKSLKFNKNSLHYKLAKLGGFDEYYSTDYNGGTDICAYTRKVLLGILATFMTMFAFAVASQVVVHTILGVVFSYFTGNDMFSIWGQIGIIFVGISIILSLVIIVPIMVKKLYYSIKKTLPEKKRKLQNPDGFIKAAYKSHKEKYCVRVEFE